jgi:lysophospholipid acyltransferase (LPLAT)-like uncharacterized protein
VSAPPRRLLAGTLTGLLARLWVSSLRLTLVEAPALAAVAERPWIYAFWHGQQLALLRWARRRPTLAMVSLSRDGALQACALPCLGMDIVRGSSSRGGAGGVRAMVRRMRAGDADAAFAVDGPRGPRGTVAPGALAVARATGGVVVPLASASAAGWVLERTWDRYELPRPFARVAVALGAPLDPRALAAEGDEMRPRAGGALDPLGIGPAIDAARHRAVAALQACAPEGGAHASARQRERDDGATATSRRVV